MIDNPLVSVVMPVYNAQKYLNKAIDSILAQTYKDFEFIIINDGSTDNSLQIIKKYQKKDKRIIVKNKKNKGIVAALNDGIKLSRGKYLARMDADDISLPSRFEVQVNFMEKNSKIGVCGTWVEVFGEINKNYLLKFPINNELLKIRLLFSVPFAHPSIMMRRDLVVQYNLQYNKKYDAIEDYKFWLDISKYTKFASIPKVLLKYRFLKTSVSKIANKDREKRYISLKKVFTEILRKMDIKNTEKENKLHYILGLNERIKQTDINLNFLNIYLIKLIEANKLKKIFDEKSLKNFMMKKFLVVIYYKFINKDLSFLNAFFFKFFWLGLLRVYSIKKLDEY